ncbi:MAG: response regulator transcription factor [Cyclobacteriaceae bacterium]|nr:response regulator transcription factor [Cyclobacteriaceae bacterium]
MILAYSLGIATLIVQIICYIKDLEYKETIFFTIAFLLLIIATTLQYLIQTDHSLSFDVGKLAINILTAVFAISIPINIHKERLDAFRKTRNIVVIIIGIILITIVLNGYVRNKFVYTTLLVSGHLFFSVLYSMVFLLLTKPGDLIKIREKTERISAIVVLTIMSLSFLLFVLNYEGLLLKPLHQNGGIILATICIFLSISKIPNDIKKLVQTEKPLPYDENKMGEFGITPREQEVLTLLITGKAYKEIALELFISLPTVKTHVSNIYAKVKVRNRLELSNLIKNNP